jgi:hypothetical protein
MEEEITSEEEITIDSDEDAEFDIISFNSVEEIEKSIIDSPFRAVYQINNFFLPQIQDVVDESKTVNLRPEYQRRSRWTIKQKSLLIESFILNVPVPPVFFFEADFARYEVMDGQQRLIAVREFLADGFKLSSLSILSPLNNLKYSTLPPRTRRTLERASLSAIVLLKESRASLRDANSKRTLELRRFVFERLNTGGKKLNAQEIRNALYPGHFNDLITSVARDPAFTDTWDIPKYSKPLNEADYDSPARRKNTLYRTMGDCQIVLRFFALRDKDNIKGSMRSILDKCMERNMPAKPEDINPLYSEYIDRLKLASEIFDEKPFLLIKGKPETISVSMYDAVMAAIDTLWEHRDRLISHKDEIISAYWDALDSSEKIEEFSGRANTSADVKDRIGKMTKLFRKAAIND